MKYTILVNKDNKIKNNFLDKYKLITTKNCLDEEIQV